METPNANTLLKNPEFLRTDKLIRANVLGWPKWLVESGAVSGLCGNAESSEGQKALKSLLAEVATKHPDFGLRDITVKKVWPIEPKLAVVYAGPPKDAAAFKPPHTLRVVPSVTPSRVDDDEDEEDEDAAARRIAEYEDLQRTSPSKSVITMGKVGANDARLFYPVEAATDVERMILAHDQAVRRKEQEATELETRIALSYVMLTLWSRIKADGKTKTLENHWVPVTTDGPENVPHAVVNGFRLRPARLTGDAAAKLAWRFEFDGKSKTAVFLDAHRGPRTPDEWAEVATELADYCKREKIENLLILK